MPSARLVTQSVGEIAEKATGSWVSLYGIDNKHGPRDTATIVVLCAGLGASQTVDVTMYAAYSAAHMAAGGVLVHTFTTFDDSNAVGVLVAPTGYSETGQRTAPVPEFVRFDYDREDTPSGTVSFSVDAMVYDEEGTVQTDRVHNATSTEDDETEITGDWIDLSELMGGEGPYESAIFFVDAPGITGSQELTAKLYFAFSETHKAEGGVLVHTFTKLTTSTKFDLLVASAGCSESAFATAPVPKWIRIDYTRESEPTGDLGFGLDTGRPVPKIA